jgi:hypothetical protein
MTKDRAFQRPTGPPDPAGSPDHPVSTPLAPPSALGFLWDEMGYHGKVWADKLKNGFRKAIGA